MSKRIINPPELFDSLQYGFSQGVVSTGRKTIRLSGQVAWNADEEIEGAGDLGVQMRASLRNVAIALQAAGATLADVVSLRIYFLDCLRADLSGIGAGLREFFPQEPPAATWIGVMSLADPAFLVEVEAVAVVD